MARTEVTKTIAPGSYSHSAVELNTVTGGAGDGYKFKASGNDLILIRNQDTSDHAITLLSIDDIYNRKQDVTITIPANDIYIVGPLKRMGWRQTDGYFYADCDTAFIEFGIIQL